MIDTISIQERNGTYSIWFLIDGKWWPVIDSESNTRTWATEDEARTFLSQRHGVDWDVDKIPTLHIE